MDYSNLASILSQMKNYFKSEIKIDSLVFRLNHLGTTIIIAVGFIFTNYFNIFDSKAIVCHHNYGEKFEEFARYKFYRSYNLF